MPPSTEVRLIDVVRFYRGLPLQTAALMELEEDIKAGRKDALSRSRPWWSTWSAAGRIPEGSQPQPEQTEWATVVQALNLSQPDAYTCQAACIGMAVGDRDVLGIRRKLEAIGTPGSPAVMGRVIEDYGVPYEFHGDACLEDVRKWLKEGCLLITHGWFTRSGHVICLDGLRQEPRSSRFSISVKDPWSEFDGPTWSYQSNLRFFDGYYSELMIYAACVAGSSRDDAASRYKAGAVDPARRGAWVHRFMPR